MIDRKMLTKQMRWQLADQLARDRLPQMNAECQTVVPSDTIYSRYIKRLLDIIISLVMLILTSPINLILAVCTFFDVGRPILFRQRRLGRNGRIFYIVKFRNMRNTRDARGELLPAKDRVTKFGLFVRKTSLDELLNFWSVLKGDMSIIGPRPLVPEYYNRYSARHKQRMAVRPGLECPPRSAITHVRNWQEQFENDVWYVAHVNFRTDCHMIVQLVRFALNKKSSEARASSTRGTFMGYDTQGNAINLDQIPQEYIDNFFGSAESNTSI